MILASPVLVGAPPPGPLRDQGCRGGRRPEEVGEQVTGFGGGQRDERRAGGRPSLGVLRRVVLDADADQEGRGEQDQGEMPIPAQVTAHFIVIES